MNYLPVSLNLFNKKVLIVGGGNVAFLKFTNIRRFTTDITFLSTEFLPEIISSGYPIIHKSYETSDLEGYSIVYACTNNQPLNTEIRQDVQSAKLLVSVCDDPVRSDFVSPATCKADEITISVGSDGTDVKRSVRIRNRILQLINEGILTLE